MCWPRALGDAGSGPSGRARRLRPVQACARGAGRRRTSDVLISTSPAMRRARALVDRIADTDVPVLLLGESGTGKEVIAREIHARSRARDQARSSR